MKPFRTFSRYAKLTVVFLATIGAGMLLVVALLILQVVQSFDGTGSVPADCAMVFGAAVHRGSRAGPGIQRRVYTATTLYHDGKLQKLFFSGGKGSAHLDSEAEVMQRLALQTGVHPEDIVIEGESRSTWQNLVNTRPLTKNCQSIIGISDRYHLARIAYLAKKQNWGHLKTYPAQWGAPLSFEARSVVREALGMLYYTFFSQN